MPDRPPMTEKDRMDLVAFLDGELRGSAAHRIETRLSLDPQVRAEADALKKTWDLLDVLPRAEPSPLFTSRTIEKLTVAKTKPTVPGVPPRPLPWKPWALGVGWAAALFVATYVGFAGFGRATPRGPTDMELVRDLRLLENKRLYEVIDDLDFLHELDHPELFGDDVRGS